MATKTDIAKPQQYNMADNASLLMLANELKQFVTVNKLTTNLQGKQYANVEAWEYIGTSMGIFPIVEEVTHIAREGEICYRATVNLTNIHTGAIVGRGVAFCSNKEPGKKGFAEYAIASMSQTRAVGKAYRLPFGWLMKAAGYEATPAEEMDTVVQLKEVIKDMENPDAASLDQKLRIEELLNNPLILISNIPDPEWLGRLRKGYEKFTAAQATAAITKLEKELLIRDQIPA